MIAACNQIGAWPCTRRTIAPASIELFRSCSSDYNAYSYCNALHLQVVPIEAVLCILSVPHTGALPQPATEDSVSSTLSAPEVSGDSVSPDPPESPTIPQQMIFYVEFCLHPCHKKQHQIYRNDSHGLSKSMCELVFLK